MLRSIKKMRQQRGKVYCGKPAGDSQIKLGQLNEVLLSRMMREIELKLNE